ncbi:MAG TPA: hypothetical protein VD837_14440 [Terriglobales bacterium]|nr:hypothetical protein [Terriglobales bacterium]
MGKPLGSVVIAGCEESKRTGYRYKLESPKRSLMTKAQAEPKFFRQF